MSAAETPASASAACATSTISDSMSRPSCLPNLLCAQPTMHPLMPPSEVPAPTIASPPAPLYPEFHRAELSRTELAFADHPLLSVHLIFDSISRGVALSEEQANNLVAASSGTIDAALGEKFYWLADAVFVL